MDKKFKEVTTKGVEIIRDYYLESARQLETSPGDILSLYLQMCSDLEQIIPVHIYGDLNISNAPTIIVANHIQTPFLFEIIDDAFLKALHITKNDFPFSPYRQYLANEIRHFPLVNFLKNHGLNSHIVAEEKPGKMNDIAENAGFLTIPPKKVNNKTKLLAEMVHKLPPSHVPILFPEGRDTEGYLELNEYHMYPFRKGSVYIAKETNSLIQVLTLSFNRKEMSYNLVVGELISLETIYSIPAEEITKTLQQIMIRDIKKAIPNASAKIIAL